MSWDWSLTTSSGRTVSISQDSNIAIIPTLQILEVNFLAVTSTTFEKNNLSLLTANNILRFEFCIEESGQQRTQLQNQKQMSDNWSPRN